MNSQSLELLDDFANLWFVKGFDSKQKLFYEALDFDGKPLDLVKRIRVQFRQVFTASRSAGIFGRAELYTLALLVRNNLWENFWQKDGGFIHLIADKTPNNKVEIDLYDQAFALLMEAELIKSKQVDDENALKVINFLNTKMRTPLKENGFIEALPFNDKTLRRQNPHMHLFEALIELIAATNADSPVHKKATALAIEIFNLFEKHFFEKGQIREFFNAHFEPRLDEWSAGHSAEWIFLLTRAKKVIGNKLPNLEKIRFYCDSLHKNLESGLRDDGFLYDEINSKKEPLATTARLWPQCEYLRAINIYNPELAGNFLAKIKKHYLNTSVTGGWFDKLSIKQSNVAENMPASSHYHLLNALQEIA